MKEVLHGLSYIERELGACPVTLACDSIYVTHAGDVKIGMSMLIMAFRSDKNNREYRKLHDIWRK